MQKNKWYGARYALLLFCIAICIKMGWSVFAEYKTAEQVVETESLTINAIPFETVSDDFSVKIEDIDDLLDDKIIGIIYFGRDTCPFCLTLNGLLKEEIEANKNIQIYKFDTDVWREDERFQEILDKYMVQSIPALIRVNEDLTVDQFVLDESQSNEEVLQSLKFFLKR